jgi:copper chaperone CopZ
MTIYQIFVENIKCSGCMNSIKTALLKLNGVSDVSIDKETEAVSITGTDMQKDMITARLAALGYPEKGSNNLLHKAKSYVSCAVGRYDKIT